MKNIDLEALAAITGGTSPRAAVLNELNNRFSSDGVVSYIGHPRVTELAGGRERVTGKFDVNALWGGDSQYRFRATVAGDHVRSLRTKPL